MECDFCGTLEAEPLIQELKVVSCTGCGVAHLEERLPDSALQQFYSEHYFNSDSSGEKGYCDYLRDKPLIKRTFHKRLKEIEKFIPSKGKALDIGCALGFFIEVARERGWSAEGLDISEYCIDHIKSEGFKGHLGLFQNLQSEENHYDLITMWDYIEHSTTPKQDIEKAYSLLKKDGILIMATPDFSSLPAKLFGNKWMGFKDHEHLYYFSKKDLNQCVESLGFELISNKFAGKYISFEFFANRLGLYFPLLSKFIDGFFKLTRLSNVKFYCNPWDIQLVIAKKR